MPEAKLIKEWADHPIGTVVSTEPSAGLDDSGRVFVDVARFETLSGDGFIAAGQVAQVAAATPPKAAAEPAPPAVAPFSAPPSEAKPGSEG